MATPFVQGRLRNQPLTVTIASACAACGREFTLALSDRGTWNLHTAPASLLVFEPAVDWSTFTAPTIVNDY